MARRKIKRKRGEGISISGPATVHVSRGVLLIIDAPQEAHIARLGKQRRAAQPSDQQTQASQLIGLKNRTDRQEFER